MVFSTFPRAGSRVQDRAQKKAEVLMWGGMGNLQLQVVIIEMVHLHKYPNHGIYSVSAGLHPKPGILQVVTTMLVYGFHFTYSIRASNYWQRFPCNNKDWFE